MKHLTGDQINKMTYYYLNKKILTDDLVEAKKHMAECKSCYEEFCISIVAAYEFGKKGLLDTKMLLSSCNEMMENVYVKISNVAGKIKVVLNDTLESAAEKLWDFAPVTQLAMARGENSDINQMYINKVSEYSSITLSDNCLTVRLDEEYFNIGEYEVVYISNDVERVIPFIHNELEECLEITIELEDENCELLIRGIQ